MIYGQNYCSVLSNTAVLCQNFQCCLFLMEANRGFIYKAAFTGLSELFLEGGCVKKVGGCGELKTEREGGLHSRFLHLN